MSPLILGLTLALLALPALFLGIGILGSGAGAPVLLPTGALLVLLYAGVWVYARPSSYRVTPALLTIVWPVRSLEIPLHEVAAARVVDLDAFKEAYGRPMRVGAGGLFGTFGFLWSRRTGRLDVYVTNLGPWVVIERRSGRPLILSPADPAAFAAALSNDPGAAPAAPR